MQQNHFVVLTGKKVVAFKLTYRTLFATSSSVEENDQNIGFHINQHTIEALHEYLNRSKQLQVLEEISLRNVWSLVLTQTHIVTE